MKALTIIQPYADDIVRGEKIIENRTWPAPSHLICQRLAIHAGASKKWLDPWTMQERPSMVFGAIVATAQLVACERIESLPYHLQDRDDANGPWCWVLDDVHVLTVPVPVKGAQGLWEWTEQP